MELHAIRGGHTDRQDLDESASSRPDLKEAGMDRQGREEQELVEPAGIEPATFWLQTRRSPS